MNRTLTHAITLFIAPLVDAVAITLHQAPSFWLICCCHVAVVALPLGMGRERSRLGVKAGTSFSENLSPEWIP
jgi:hypothetical protein